MAQQIEDNPLAALVPLLTNGSDNPLAQALSILLNAAMQFKRKQHIGAAPYERNSQRNGQANGFKDRLLSTRLGELSVSVPQIRNSSEAFRPQSLEVAVLSEKALKVALAEMYVQGISTRKVSAVSSMTVSRATQVRDSEAVLKLDSILSAWRERLLGVFPFVQFDALWCKVRQNGLVKDAAVLVASGVGENGKRLLLGVSISSGEHEVHWRSFFESLVTRGLRGIRLITSDDHIHPLVNYSGLKAARRAVFGGVEWQRCQFHLQQNAQAYIPKEEMKKEVAAKIRTIFNASDLTTAQSLLRESMKEYSATAPNLSAWLEEAIPEGLMVFTLPEGQRRFLRTSNGLERVNKELRRHFRVVGSFVFEASCLRLASAILMEISDQWETGKVYLSMENEKKSN